jgi:hypothetical protein
MAARGVELELVIIDYLQKLRPNHKTRDRIEAVTEISQDLKTLAKENDVGVLALSQLSRAVEARTDHRPQLSDLRESGQIEQDADLVLFLFRAEYYLDSDRAGRKRRRPKAAPNGKRPWKHAAARSNSSARSGGKAGQARRSAASTALSRRCADERRKALSAVDICSIGRSAIAAPASGSKRAMAISLADQERGNGDRLGREMLGCG